jgi:hypothetical protein
MTLLCFSPPSNDPFMLCRSDLMPLLETDDPYLLQELRSYKTIDQAVPAELPHAVVIDGKAGPKMKREIEKRNHFCNLHPADENCQAKATPVRIVIKRPITSQFLRRESLHNAIEAYQEL